MEDLNKPLHIVALVVKSFQGQLTEKEEQELKEWLSVPENQRLYRSLSDKDLKNKKQQISRLHPRESWQKIERQITFVRSQRFSAFIRYAAAIFLPLLIATILFYLYRSQPIPEAPLSENISPVPGSPNAVLTLESGKQIELKGRPKVWLQPDSSVVFSSNGHTLEVNISDQNTIPQESYQTLSIPIGGEYKLVLSDGTQVWLNSHTQLRFPSTFTGKERKVYLKGEAYFEVSHRADLPFIVSTKDLEVQVLGTKFNVKAYEEDPVVYTTLAEGAVRTFIPQAKKSLLLSPNQQCLYTKQNGHLEQKEADARIFTGWTEGRFVFENETLEEIMKQVCRWYGVEVIYQAPRLKEYRFTGNVDRFERIFTLLQMIEKTYPISFTLHQNTIIVSQKQT